MLLRCSSICSILSKDKDGDKTNWLSFPADVPFIFKPFFFVFIFMWWYIHLMRVVLEMVKGKLKTDDNSVRRKRPLTNWSAARYIYSLDGQYH